MKIFIFLFSITILLNSCVLKGIMEEQNSFLNGLKISKQLKEIELLENINIKQTRGQIKTDYFCSVGKGKFKLLWESNKGEFYLSENKSFLCEGMDVGGVFYFKEKNEYFIWGYPNGFKSKKKTLLKLKDPKFVKSLKRLSSVKPFVFSNYRISIKYFFGNNKR